MDSTTQLLICLPNFLLAECLSYAIARSRSTSCRAIRPSDLKKLDNDLSFDILILSAASPEEDLQLACESFRKANPIGKIALFFSAAEADRVMEFTALRTDGCLYETSTLEELVLALTKIVNGEQYCAQPIANAIFASASRSAQLRSDNAWASRVENIRLTQREREVLELITWERLGNKQIARKLCISLHTVKNHVHSIIEKLGVQDRYQAAEVATKSKLLLAR